MTRCRYDPRRNWSSTTFQHYIVYSNHYIHTFSMQRVKKGETEIGYRETWHSTTATLVLFMCPEYTGSPFYVPIRRTMMKTMDIHVYNENMSDMCREPTPSIEHRSSAWKARCITAWPPRLPGWMEWSVTASQHKKAILCRKRWIYERMKHVKNCGPCSHYVNGQTLKIYK